MEVNPATGFSRELILIFAERHQNHPTICSVIDSIFVLMVDILCQNLHIRDQERLSIFVSGGYAVKHFL